jgi:hypothetical protein
MQTTMEISYALIFVEFEGLKNEENDGYKVK